MYHLSVLVVVLLVSECVQGNSELLANCEKGFGCASIETSVGTIKGNAWGHANEFLRIPFAEPFTHNFQPPVDWTRRIVPPHSDMFDATDIRPDGSGACLQPGPPFTPGPGKAYGVADCLFLNVWAPATPPPEGERRPILLWLFGGDNTVNEILAFNASELAGKHNAVIAAANYRLGALGFAAFASDVTAGESTGNLGMMDILSAARWLQRNARAFGADPLLPITTFGESSGATLSQLMMMIPAAQGVIGKSIAESGGIYAQSLPNACAATRDIARVLGCPTHPDAEMKACMQRAPAAEIVYNSQNSSWGPTVDGIFLREDPSTLLAKGLLNTDVDILWGGNTNDSAHPSYGAHVSRKEYISRLNDTIHGRGGYGERQRVWGVQSPMSKSVRHRQLHLHYRAVTGMTGRAHGMSIRADDALLQRALELYPPIDGNNVLRVGWFQSDQFLCTQKSDVLLASTAFANRSGKNGGRSSRAYLYRFNWWFQSNKECTADSNYHPPQSGSNHCDEMTFVFGQPIYDLGASPGDGYANCSDPASVYFDKTCAGCHFNSTEAQFSLDVGAMWTSFARTGVPRITTPAGRPWEWPRFVNHTAPVNVVLQPTAEEIRYVAEENMGRTAACALWDDVASAHFHSRQ
eukprot:m.383668 g.383668  ORF g.383668 m.383668 type:complete len:636 (+) comp20983_c0_seq1:104-2011(+)